jgi:hydroxymethylpyrimidine kinase/phosphomethylpyrimidine kinase
MNQPIIASIGTTHPWNTAGVGLDALVAADLGVAHAVAVAGVSAQDAYGLHGVHAVPAQMLRAQLDALPPGIGAYCVGALVSSENVRIVAEYVRVRVERIPVIVDPVIQVTLGGVLRSDDSLLATLRDELLTLAVIATPNVHEAADLAGFEIETLDQMRRAAQAIVSRGARAALVKGGHIEGEPIDVLATTQQVLTFGGERLPGAMRGSGCTLAAALACELAQGRALQPAVAAAHAYVRRKISARTIRGGLQVAF